MGYWFIEYEQWMGGTVEWVKHCVMWYSKHLLYPPVSVFNSSLMVPQQCSVVLLCHFTITITHNFMNEIWSTTAYSCSLSENQEPRCLRKLARFLGNLELFMKIVKKEEFIMTANLGTCFMFSIWASFRSTGPELGSQCKTNTSNRLGYCTAFGFVEISWAGCLFGWYIYAHPSVMTTCTRYGSWWVVRRVMTWRGGLLMGLSLTGPPVYLLFPHKKRNPGKLNICRSSAWIKASLMYEKREQIPCNILFQLENGIKLEI